jgi:hypothetical protein
LLLRCCCDPASTIAAHLRCLLVGHVQCAQLLWGDAQQMVPAAKLVRIIINVCRSNTVSGSISKHKQVCVMQQVAAVVVVDKQDRLQTHHSHVETATPSVISTKLLAP